MPGNMLVIQKFTGTKVWAKNAKKPVQVTLIYHISRLYKLSITIILITIMLGGKGVTN